MVVRHSPDSSLTHTHTHTRTLTHGVPVLTNRASRGKGKQL